LAKSIIDQLLSKKLEEVDKVFHLAESILDAQALAAGQRELFDFKDLNSDRSAEREKILMEMPKSGKSGKPKKAKTTKSKKDPNAPTTHEVSIEMAERGLTVEAIAKERSLVVSTIEGHLAKGVETGRISIFKFMQEPDVEKIASVLKEMPEGFSSYDVYSKLNGRYGYGQLRAVMMHTGIKSVAKKPE
jgi:hypothetical protein